MKNKRIGTLLLAGAMLVTLTACGGQTGTATESKTSEAAVSSTASTASAAPVTVTAAPASAEEASAESSVETPKYTVTYPLDTGTTLTMVAKLEANMQSIITSFGDVMAMQQYEKDTGVDVTFKMLGDTVFDEQLNLLISSADLPDLVQSGMAGYATKLSAAIDDDVLMDISPLLEEYAPDYYSYIQKDESFAENIYNDNGTTSVFCGVGIPVVDSGMFVRGDWMDAQNLETPATVSELTDVLKKLQSAYGTSMTLLVNAELSSGLEASFNTVANGFDSLNFQLTAPDSGTVVAGLASDGYFDYLTYLRELYADGLINDSFSGISKMLNTYNSCYWDGTCAVWSEGNRCADPAEYSNSADPNYAPRAIADVTSDDGDGVHVKGLGSTVGRGAMYVTAKCSDPETAVSFMNYAYTESGINLCSFGVEGTTYERVSEDEVNYTDLIANNPDMVERDAEVYYLISNWMPTVQTQAMYNLKNSVEEVRAAADLWTKNCGDDTMTLPDGVSLSAEDTDTVNGMATDILTLISEKAPMYVMGTLDEAGFHQAIEDSMGMGLTEITEIYQNAYDSYMAEHSES